MSRVFQEMEHRAPGRAIILAGGTALARGDLNHRVSYDLDFFIDNKFDPAVIGKMLTSAGVAFKITAMEKGDMFAAQLHGVALAPRLKKEIKLSFIEDVFAGMFEHAIVNGLKTEVLDGLYHRKLRTLSGTGETTCAAGHILGVGARQTARDLFDLYVLDTKVEPIDVFIARINRDGANFPKDIFQQNLAAVQWMDLADECEFLEVIKPFENPTAMELKRHFDCVFKRLLQCDRTKRAKPSRPKT